MIVFEKTFKVISGRLLPCFAVRIELIPKRFSVGDILLWILSNGIEEIIPDVLLPKMPSGVLHLTSDYISNNFGDVSRFKSYRNRIPRGLSCSISSG